MAKTDTNFQNSSGVFSPTKMISDISEFARSVPDSFYRLVIGTDSQVKRVNGKSEIDFVTAIIIHRVGSGARYYYRKEKDFTKRVLRDRIYKETAMSLATAQELVPSIRKALSAAKYDLEIHIDVGPLGKTREMIKEVVGMVSGNGYKAKTKPEAWGAQSVADKHT